jgi:glucokinase
MKTVAIGVDVGGSHVSCAACNLEKRKYLPETHSENKLDNQGSSDEILGIWAKTIAECIEKAKPAEIAGLGFAMPGPFDYYKGIPLFKGENKKYENIYGLDVPKLLRRLLGLDENFHIRFINDATAFAIGEDWIGKAAGTNRSLSITLGTGFGSAFLKNSMPVVDGNEVPPTGAVWHLPFENGTADEYFSTRGLLKRFSEKTGEQLSGVKELAGIANENTTVQELFYDFGWKLGVFLKPWIEIFGVEVLVIGGNISKAFSLFGNSLDKYFRDSKCNLKIEISELKETASMIGSAVLIDNDYYSRVKPMLLKM